MSISGVWAFTVLTSITLSQHIVGIKHYMRNIMSMTKKEQAEMDSLRDYKANNAKPVTTNVQGVVRQPANGFVNVYEEGGNIKVIYTETHLDHLLSQCKQGHVGEIIRFHKAGSAMVIYPEDFSSFGDALNDPKNKINMVPCNNQLDKVIKWNTTNKIDFLEEAHA